jgi:hypothetical protein
MFHCTDRRYVHLDGLRWSVDDEWVKNNFSRYVDDCIANVNTMVDLIQTAAHDRGYVEDCPQYFGRHLNPFKTKPVAERPKFTFWETRPEDLAVYYAGTVTNLSKVIVRLYMYLPCLHVPCYSTTH